MIMFYCCYYIISFIIPLFYNCYRDKASTKNRRCKVIYSYKENKEDELTLAVGDILEIFDEVEEGNVFKISIRHTSYATVLSIASY